MASLVYRASARSILSSSSRLCNSPSARQCLATSSIRQFTSTRKTWEKRYTEDHEWIELSEDKTTGTVGITKFAAKALGDVVYVELPTVGTEVSAADTIGAVESVKSASDIMTPAAGTIAEVNSVLEDSPSTINKSPEDEGWLAKIKVSSPEDIGKLMSEKAYIKFTEKPDDSH